MVRHVFFSHDGYGVGHLRRNTLIARALLDRDPDASAILVTGIPTRPSWLGSSDRLSVVQVPPLVKDSSGVYRSPGASFEDAVRARGRIFDDVVRRSDPAVVVVDRHPYGTAGELRAGLHSARRAGARVVLGLRDVLDDPAVVVEEIAGRGWDGVCDVYEGALVYGARHFCDHDAEYGLPLRPTYCGWVTEAVQAGRDPRLLVVAAGGGGDGAAVFRLGVEVLAREHEWVGVLAAGPYTDLDALRQIAAAARLRHRFRIDFDRPGCGSLFAAAGASLQMAGYNSTFESLAAGLRPILVPRWLPRREQAVRAERLQRLGLADVVPPGGDAATVATLLEAPRLLAPGALAAAGVELDGAARAAELLTAAVELARP